MKVTEQIDALEATAVDSFQVSGGDANGRLRRRFANSDDSHERRRDLRRLSRRSVHCADVAAALFRPGLFLVDFTDLVPATLKTAVFGFIIAVVSSFLGMTTTQGTEGVGRASTRSVVMSSVVLIVVNVVLVRLIFLLFPETA